MTPVRTDHIPRGLWLARLTRNVQVSQKQMIIPIDETDNLHDDDRESLKEIVSLIAGYQIIHFDTPDAHAPIDRALTAQGMIRIDTPIFDIAPFTRRILLGDIDAELAIDDIPRICGRPLRAPSTFQEQIPHAGRLLEMTYASIVHPKLGSEQDLGSRRRATRRTCVLSAPPVCPAPRMAPAIPEIRPPVDGWRTDPWMDAEAADVTRRFIDGDTLESLCGITGRSPIGILSRLQRDNIIQREQPAPRKNAGTRRLNASGPIPAASIQNRKRNE